MTSLRTALALQVLRDLLSTRGAARTIWVDCGRCTLDCRLVDLREISKGAGRLNSLCRPDRVLRCEVCRGRLRPARPPQVSVSQSAIVIDFAAARRRRRNSGTPTRRSTAQAGERH